MVFSPPANPVNKSWTRNASSPALDGNYPNGDRAGGGDTYTGANFDVTGDLTSAGNEIVIDAKGVTAFGNDAPELVMLIDLADQSVGDLNLALLKKAAGVAHNFGAAPALQVEANTGMPGGKGIQIGGNTSALNSATYAQMRGTFTAANKTFESRCFYWPQAHQGNADAYITANGGAMAWQLKSLWNLVDYLYAYDPVNGETDFYGIQGTIWEPSTTEFHGSSIAGNNLPSTLGHAATGMNDQGATHKGLFPEVYQVDLAYDLGATLGADGEAGVLITRPSTIVTDTQLSGVRLVPATATDKLINSFTYPGYVRGYNVPLNYHMLEGEIYKAAGSGAFCRVLLANHQDYHQATKRTYLEVTHWINNQIKFLSRAGRFDLSSLEGNYLLVMDETNTQVGYVAL